MSQPYRLPGIRFQRIEKKVSDGGAVLDKRSCNGPKHFGWYDATGALIDVEAFDSLNRARPASHNAWEKIRTGGYLYTFRRQRFTFVPFS